MQCPNFYFFSISTELYFGGEVLKFPHVKFHENPASVCRIVPYGRTDRRWYTIQSVMKLTVAFHSCSFKDAERGETTQSG
jgi:hypothetical protein